MTNLTAQPAEVHFTLEIKRAATGLTETVQMVGHVVNPDAATEQPQPAPIDTQEQLP